MLRVTTTAATLLAAALVAGSVAVGSGCSGDSKSGGDALPPGCTNPSADEPPDDLKCTGLIAADGVSISTKARPYAPSQPFWSDGYEKDRYVSIPEGKTIDATSMDDWKYPAGTKLWKTFRKGDRKIETRLLWKYNDEDWRTVTYMYSDDGKSSTRGEGKTTTLDDGTVYTIPKGLDCEQCHRGRKDRVLGFEAISLAQPNATGVTLQTLVDEKKIDPAPAATSVTLPDPGIAVLHVNCGVTCHNSVPAAKAYSTELRFRVLWNEANGTPLTDWESYKSYLNVPAKLSGNEGTTRLIPGDPDNSLIVHLMSARGDGSGQMPPLATNIVDDDGLGKVKAYITSLGGGGLNPPPTDLDGGTEGGTVNPPGPPPPPVGPPPPPPPTCSNGGVGEVESNDAIASATPLNGGSALCGSLSGAGDNDYFSFTTPGNMTTFDWSLAVTSGVTPTVTWRNSGGTVVSPPLAAGTAYTVQLSGAGASSYGIMMTFGH